MSAPLVKVCGLRRREDAELAAALGAAYGGVILAPGGKRSIDPAAAGAVLRELPLQGVGVFVDARLDSARRDAEAAGLHVLQLHGDETPELAAALRAEGRWKIWKALRPRGAAEFLDGLQRFAGTVDGVLVDGWSPAAAGGTGSRFPWEEVAAHRDLLPPDTLLVVAGGLTPGNVASAVALLRPGVVDVSSGVELSPGVKDPASMSAFVVAARGAAQDPAHNH